MTGLGSSCGACKFLRRKCTSECVFAPYFCYDQAAAHFAAVHKVFGASNVSKLLSHLPAYNRSAAAITISYEALARMRDPIYGCVAHIFALQQQVASLQEEIDLLGNQIANLNVGISSCESSQRTSIQNSEMQFSLHQDAMATEYYQTQPTVLLNHFGYTSGDQASDGSHMDIEISPPYGWEAENLLCDYEQTPLERHFEGVNKEMLTLLHDYTMGTTETENVQLGTKKSFSSNPFKLVLPEKSFGCKWD